VKLCFILLTKIPFWLVLLSSQPGEKIVQYPVRPVDTTTEFEGTTSLQPNQPVSLNLKEPKLLVRCNTVSMWNLVTGTV
jgi:cyclin-dependent kinase 8/11